MIAMIQCASGTVPLRTFLFLVTRKHRIVVLTGLDILYAWTHTEEMERIVVQASNSIAQKIQMAVPYAVIHQSMIAMIQCASGTVPLRTFLFLVTRKHRIVVLTGLDILYAWTHTEEMERIAVQASNSIAQKIQMAVPYAVIHQSMIAMIQCASGTVPLRTFLFLVTRKHRIVVLTGLDILYAWTHTEEMERIAVQASNSIAQKIQMAVPYAVIHQSMIAMIQCASGTVPLRTFLFLVTRKHRIVVLTGLDILYAWTHTEEMERIAVQASNSIAQKIQMAVPYAVIHQSMIAMIQCASGTVPLRTFLFLVTRKQRIVVLTGLDILYAWTHTEEMERIAVQASNSIALTQKRVKHFATLPLLMIVMIPIVEVMPPSSMLP